MFDFLYEIRGDEVRAFGPHYIEPPGDRLQHGEATLIARYSPNDGSDGKTAEVYVVAMPARFYEVRVEGWPVKLTTGSGDDSRELVAQIAHAAACGMLGARPSVS